MKTSEEYWKKNYHQMNPLKSFGEEYKAKYDQLVSLEAKIEELEFIIKDSFYNESTESYLHRRLKDHEQQLKQLETEI